MPTRRLSLILPLLLLPSLLSCSGNSEPAGPPPVSKEALAAVIPNPGISREKLARAVDALFSDKQAGETHALLVLHDGRIVAERYGSGFDSKMRLTGWSMAASVTGVMTGLLVSDGRLRLNEPAPVPAWQRPGDPRGEITLRQLLQMRSGLTHTEVSDPPYKSDRMRMLFLDGRDDMAAYAEAQPLEALPGRKFEYSSATAVILSDLAARTLVDGSDPDARRKAVAQYLRTRLFEPLGMHSAVVEFDAAGTFIGSSMVYATARDWARFGEFLRLDGSVRGAQILPRRWIKFMTSPSPANPGFGAQLWLNRPQRDGKDVLFPGKAPRSLFACIGHLGQYVIVSPRQKLTVVRLGHTTGRQRAELRERLSDIVALFPSG